jgi:hypothetical protein
MVYVIQVCGQLASWIRIYPNPARKLSANLYDIYRVPLLCVQWKTPEDGQRNCPKHVELHSKNKYEKLVHLVGFILRNMEYISRGVSLHVFAFGNIGISKIKAEENLQSLPQTEDIWVR